MKPTRRMGYVFSPHGNIASELSKQGPRGFTHTTNYLALEALLETYDTVYVFTTDVEDHTVSLPHGCVHVRLPAPLAGWQTVGRVARRERLELLWLECGPSLPYAFRVRHAGAWVHLNYDNQWWNTSENPFKRAVLRVAEDLLLAHVDSAAVATDEIMRAHRRRLAGKVVPYRKGVDTRFFNPGAVAAYGGAGGETQGGGPTACWVGRLSPVKNPLRLLRVYERLRQKIPRLQLEVVGDGELCEECREFTRAHGLGGVTFHGSRDLYFVRQVLGRSDMYLLTSDYDASPKTVMEALAMEVPAVAMDVGGVKDFTYGFTGLLARDEEELYRNALRVLDDLPRYRRLAAKVGAVIRRDHDLRTNLRHVRDEVVGRARSWGR